MRRAPVMLSAFGLLTVVLAVPAMASACPSLSGAKTFRGKADVSFSGSASGNDETIRLEHHAVGIKVSVTRPSLSPTPSPFVVKKLNALHHGFAPLIQYIGKTGGGVVVVQDQFSYTASGETITGRQSAAGPEVATSGFQNLSELATVRIDPMHCTYQLSLSYLADTTSFGQWPSPPDKTVGGFVSSPVKPLPSSLKIHGVADVPVTEDCAAKELQLTGCGEMGGATSAWWSTYDNLRTCGGQPSPCPSPQSLGTVRFEWRLKPK